jgi:hypothetical protein
MTDNTRKWLQTAPLPALILGAYVYAYAIDNRAAEADKNAALAVAVRQEQSERLKRVEDKLDRLTEAIAQLNLATTVRLNRLEDKQPARPAKEK